MLSEGLSARERAYVQLVMRAAVRYGLKSECCMKSSKLSNYPGSAAHVRAVFHKSFSLTTYDSVDQTRAARARFAPPGREAPVVELHGAGSRSMRSSACGARCAGLMQ